MAKIHWKQLAPDNDGSDIVTWRAKVPGGWLVSVWAAKAQADGGGKTPVPGGSNWGGGVAFVPGDDWDVDPVAKG
jgi:hypothetical protein